MLWAWGLGVRRTQSPSPDPCICFCTTHPEQSGSRGHRVGDSERTAVEEKIVDVRKCREWVRGSKDDTSTAD